MKVLLERARELDAGAEIVRFTPVSGETYLSPDTKDPIRLPQGKGGFPIFREENVITVALLNYRALGLKEAEYNWDDATATLTMVRGVKKDGTAVVIPR